MSLPCSLLPALLFALQVHSYALPNPQVVAATPAIPQAPAATPLPGTDTASADSAEITDFSTLPQSYWDAFTSELGGYSIDSAELASESAAYASWTKDFYATVAPSQLAAISSYNRAESSAYAAWTSELYETIGTSEYNAITSEYAQWTSEQAIYATYTGTGIPPGISASPINSANGSIAEITGADGVVRDNPAATTTAAGAGVAQATFGPLSRTQTTPGAYSLTCLDSSASDMGRHDVDYNACFTTITDICASLADPSKLITEQWVWSEKGQGCAMGYWIPLVGATQVIAPLPSVQECQGNIFGQMRNTCIPINSVNGHWNAASVNIAVVPTAENAGQQVDSGKVSYMIAGSPYPCGPKGCATPPADNSGATA